MNEPTSTPIQPTEPQQNNAPAGYTDQQVKQAQDSIKSGVPMIIAIVGMILGFGLILLIGVIALVFFAAA